jgi:hypoxanthine phosphoribosyltransferase
MVLHDADLNAVIIAQVTRQYCKNTYLRPLNMPEGLEQTIKIHDRYFAINIHERDIANAVRNLAARMNRELDGTMPLFVGVLNGSFMFLSDLMKEISIPCEISFVKVASYEGTTSTGKVKQLVGLNENIKGRTVVIVEDIVDTGNTIEHLVESLETQRPATIKIATLLLKPEAYTKQIPIDFAALQVPNDFLIGYGLDFNGQGRNLRHIYKITENEHYA